MVWIEHNFLRGSSCYYFGSRRASEARLRWAARMMREDLVQALRRLTPKELADVVFDATANIDPVGDASPSRFVLAIADVEEHTISLVCRPEQPWAAGAPFCQSGLHRGFATLSWAKEAACPICGGAVRGS